MAFVNEVLDEVNKFLDEGYKLRSSMCEDYEADENDWVKISRMCERMHYFREDLFSIVDFYFLLHTVEYQSEKDKFEAQKIIVRNFKRFIERIDDIIEVGRIWKYRDYRCIDWVKRLTEFMVEIKDGFEVMFQIQG